MFVEPLIIFPRSQYIQHWVHPEIEELTTNLVAVEKDFLLGDLVRIDLTFDKNRSVHIIYITDKNGVSEIMTEDGMPEYLGRLSILLNEKAMWNPGNEEFVKSEFGVIFNKMYPMYDEEFNIAASLDIALKTLDKQWWFVEYEK